MAMHRNDLSAELCKRAVELGGNLQLQSTSRREAFYSAAAILAHSQPTPKLIRLMVLQWLERFLNDTNAEFRPGIEEVATVLFKALQLELRRTACQQSVEFQQKLVTLVSRYPHPEAHAFLQAIGDHSCDPQHKRLTASFASKLSESLMSIWENTAVDQTASDQFREVSLCNLQSMILAESERVQVIFNACKGAPITNLEDRRLSLLCALLEDESEMVVVATAVTLSQIYEIEPGCSVAARAVEVLTDIAVNGPTRYMSDCAAATKAFARKSKSLRSKVETACTVANQRFLFNALNTGNPQTSFCDLPQ